MERRGGHSARGRPSSAQLSLVSCGVGPTRRACPPCACSLSMASTMANSPGQGSQAPFSVVCPTQTQHEPHAHMVCPKHTPITAARSANASSRLPASNALNLTRKAPSTPFHTRSPRRPWLHTISHTVDTHAHKYAHNTRAHQPRRGSRTPPTWPGQAAPSTRAA